MPTPLAARRVHFDSTQNLIHPLSPTSSLSSLDTDGPETPPSPHHALPPGRPFPHYPKHPFSPALSTSSSSSYDPRLPGPMAIHPSLAPHTPINYDLVLPFDPAALRLAPAALLAPATHPPMTALTVSLAAFGCPPDWLVTVTPSTAAAASGGEYARAPELVPFVTVADVLAHLYTALRTPVSKLEFDRLDGGMKKGVSESFHRRYMRYLPERGRRGSVSGQAPRSRSASVAGRTRSASFSAVDPRYEEERRKGVKRVDWMQGYTRFEGLSWIGGNRWALHRR